MRNTLLGCYFSFLSFLTFYGFETNIHHIQVEMQNTARLKFVNSINNFSQQNHPQKKPPTEFQKELMSIFALTKTFLKNNPNILMTKADKSSTAVAMNKCDYENELLKMLSDRTTYELLNYDPTRKAEKKLIWS